MQAAHVALRAIGRDLLADLRRHVGERFSLFGFDLGHGDDDGAETALHRRAHFAVLEREGGVGNRRIDDFVFRHGAEVEVLVLEAAFGRERGKTQAVLDPRLGGLRFLHGREYDLLDVTPLRRDIAAAAGIELRLDVGLGDFHPAAEFLGRHRDDFDLAVFGCAEHDFALLEILAELLRRRRRDVARLRRSQRHIFDIALLVLKLVDRFEPSFRHRHVAIDQFDDLPPQHQPALLGNDPLFGHADGAQELIEAVAIELAGRTAERRIFGDAADDFLVGQAEPHLPRALVEPGIVDHSEQHRAFETDRLGLFRRDRLADLAAELLEALVIGAAELLDRDFRAADLRQRRAAEAFENIVDPPDGEGRGQKAHDHAHDDAAEPIRGGVADTSKHNNSFRSFPRRRESKDIALSRYFPPDPRLRGDERITAAAHHRDRHAGPQPTGPSA